MLISMKKIQLFLKVAAALVLVVTGIIISSGQKAEAASPAQSITISPTSIDQSVQPDSVNNGSFQVINSGSANFTFSVYATPFRVTNEAYNPAFTPIPGAPNAMNWIHFSNSGAEIAARQT